MLRCTIPLFLMLISTARGQEPLPAFARVSGLPQAVALRRIPAGDQWDLVVALASANPKWWSTKDRLGILLVDRADSAKIQPLAIEPGPNDDCNTKVERFTLQELVMSCVGEKPSWYDNQKFVYDVAARKLLRHFTYAPFSAERLLPGPRFVMTNSHGHRVVELDPATGDPRLSAAIAPIPAEPPAVPSRFHVTPAGIAIGTGQPHPLPQTAFEAWKEARPADVRSFGRPDMAQIHEEVGPHQEEGGRLWFGKTFYNGEGETGLGGFGYFDTTYHLIAPPEMYDWAVSAILLEPDAVWLALYRRGEYGNYPGPLLRWDRATTAVQTWPLATVATSLARSGDSLYLGAVDGILRLADNRITSYFVDRSAVGQYAVVAR